MKAIKFIGEEKGSAFLIVNEKDLNGLVLDNFDDGMKGTFEIFDISEEEYNNLPEFDGFY